MDFPLERVTARYAAEENVSIEVARELERELKRYLALCALRPKMPYGMFGPVDDLWHTFLMFTRDYEQFCQTVAGRFIHHVPATADSENERASQLNTFAEMLADYRQTFGEEAPAHIWPRFAYVGDANGCTGCNGCTTDASAHPGCDGCSGCGTE
jgi:hypothetical protein